jgi:putative ABC transport system ATP-binding protein
MSVFQRLNREVGLTVVLVTHEPDIAQYASRIVVVRDGLITRDQTVADRRDASAELEAMPPTEEQLEEQTI